MARVSAREAGPPAPGPVGGGQPDLFDVPPDAGRSDAELPLAELQRRDLRNALLRSFGLDKPLWEQYLIYLRQLLHAQTSASRSSRARPVWDILMEALPNTVVLTLVSLSSPTRSASSPARSSRSAAAASPRRSPSRPRSPPAPRRNSGSACCCWRCSRSSSAGSRPAARSAPARHTRHRSARASCRRDFWWHLCLPALTLTLFLQGLPLLLMRATMLEVLNDEFIVMARMKGLSRWTIVMRHAARNALLPVVTTFALGLGAVDRRQRGGGDGVRLARHRARAGDRPCKAPTIRWRRARSS